MQSKAHMSHQQVNLVALLLIQVNEMFVGDLAGPQLINVLPFVLPLENAAQGFPPRFGDVKENDFFAFFSHLCT